MLAFDLVKQTIRQPYAWPGGYPLFFVMADGEALSIQAARENYREICRAHIYKDDPQWTVAAYDVNWEDMELTCSHTGKPIECAYGD